MNPLKYQDFNRLFHFLPIGVRERYPGGWTTVQTVQTGDKEFHESEAPPTSEPAPTSTPSPTNTTGTNESKVDFILVTSRKALADAGKARKVHNFLNSLQGLGIEVQMDYGQAFPDNMFIKLYIPDPVVKHLASLYNVELSYLNPNYASATRPVFKIFQTELDLREESYLVQRAPETIMDLRPTRATNAEKSTLLYSLMTKTWFDENVEDYGVERMLSRGILTAAYPVHEGRHKWTTEGPLTDRQLLAKFWASYFCIHKNQPLNLIEKYFGTELGMYFAFFDFYVKYMAPAAVVGVLFYFWGVLNANMTSLFMIEDEVCKSDIRLCPLCHIPSMCKYQNFSDYCELQKTRATMDNTFSSVFAILMSIWGIFFIFFWKRRLNILRMRWNVFKVRLEKGIRPEFIEQTTKIRKSAATGNEEHYIDRYTRCYTLTATNVCIVLIAILIMLFAMSVVVFQNRLSYRIAKSDDKATVRNSKIIKKVLNAIMVVIQIFIFSPWFPKIAFYFTNREIPSTQHNFDNSYITKFCILLFANGCSAIIYLTFIKGRTYEHPGSVSDDLFIRELAYDLCGPTGCYTDLGFTLGAIFFWSSAKSMVKMILKPMIKLFIKRKKNKLLKKDLPQWELDFILFPSGRYQMFSEYFDLLIQYLYILCFVSAFPLAPMFAVIRNAVKIRVDAKKYLKQSRRITPKKVRGIGPYSKLFSWVTNIGIFVNACVIAFSSSFIIWIMYEYFFNTEGGYYKFILSEFDTADLPGGQLAPDNRSCFYPGIRYPPDDSRRYQLTTEYFIILVAQLAFVLIYEQIMIYIRAVLRLSLNEKPRVVREKVFEKEELVQEARQKIINDLYKEAATIKF